MGNKARPGQPFGRRALLVAGLVLLFSALLGELTAPVHVLPVPLTVAELVLVGGGLYALMWAEGGAIGPPVSGRGLRLGALVVLAPVPFQVMGPRHALLALLVILYVVLAGAVMAMACLIGLWWRPRDAGIALLALVVGVVGGGVALDASDDVRLRFVADRLRSEAEAVRRDPPPPWTYGQAPVGEALPVYSDIGTEPDGAPVGAAWIWMRTIGPDAEPRTVVYAPGSRLVDGDRLEPAVETVGEGASLTCRTAAVDDFYWCFFE